MNSGLQVRALPGANQVLILFSLVLQFNLLAFDNVCSPNASFRAWCWIGSDYIQTVS
jgi:hypothetical protein